MAIRSEIRVLLARVVLAERACHLSIAECALGRLILGHNRLHCFYLGGRTLVLVRLLLLYRERFSVDVRRSVLLKVLSFIFQLIDLSWHLHWLRNNGYHRVGFCLLTPSSEARTWLFFRVLNNCVD